MISDIFQTILIHPLLNLLVFFYNYIPDIGIVIILVTVVVRLLLFPSFHKSLKHQKILSNLQPKMNAIRAEHKDDKEKQAKAMMELYKVHKINPLSSCLPLLIQLPILIALYRVFIQSLKGETLEGIYSFIRVPESINPMFLNFIDLSQKNIPLAAVAAILQFLQGKMQQPSVKSSDMTQQIMAQQTMYMFPLMTLVLGATLLPAGLTLYWIVTTLFGIGQQYYIIRKEAKEALYGTAK